ncbi:Telomere length regulation protein TEL2 homolog [Linum perenne]
MESDGTLRKELDTMLLDEVGRVISAIKAAKHVDQVICALHSLSVLLFPTDSSLIVGSLNEPHRDQVLSAKIPAANVRKDSWRVFYKGAGFPTLARVLLLDIASNWLACFPYSVKQHVYDVYFVHGLAIEVIQSLVPCLRCNLNDGLDAKAVQLNTQRLLVLCLLENGGLLQMARELGDLSDELTQAQLLSVISRMAQIVTSIPDKAPQRASNSLSSHLFFKQITNQLLSLAHNWGETTSDKESTLNKCDTDAIMIFIGDTFSRICRRGSTDVLLDELIPQLLKHVRTILSSKNDSVSVNVFESDSGSQFWLRIMEAIKDPYSVERISEQLLLQLATRHASNTEAYWNIHLLFKKNFEKFPSIRSMFLDKFLLWKVFPLRCLIWILQFAVLQCPPISNQRTKGHATEVLVDTVQRLVSVWSNQEFIQSTPTEQQFYVTAAIGLCMEKMSREELDMSKVVMHSILQGVSCRLENPGPLIRKMASNIALVFSKVIDPTNPLYLDDSFVDGAIDWEFGLTKHEKGTLSDTRTLTTLESVEDSGNKTNDHPSNTSKCENRRASRVKMIDPDEIVDPAMLNYESAANEDEDDVSSETSESSDGSSLQPYDLADDDSDLKRNIIHLADIIGGLRKSDDPDAVDGALDAAEKLVRASPDELKHIAGELVRCLVQVRCSDLAVEGDEDSAEEKRQRALVALLVTSPLESLHSINKLLYSPHVDTSQRIMILDVMTEAAQELASSKTLKSSQQSSRALISTISESQPWFLPSSKGPPGSTLWKEVSETGTPLNYSHRYERVVPSKSSRIMKGKTRRWSIRSTASQQNEVEGWTKNKFPVYAAAFMLPSMQGFDKKRQGVDLLGRDFIVLGKLIYMLGVCMRCASLHPEASALASPLLDMLRTREICGHKEAYVRKSVLFATSSILVSLHPSFVASSITTGNGEVAKGLEWIRRWAIEVTESDRDRECYMMAMACLQLHAEMALQTSRVLESTEDDTSIVNPKGGGVSLVPSSLQLGTIKIPHSNLKY